MIPNIDCISTNSLNSIIYFDFNFSMPKNQLALYPTWVILYGTREIVPMLMLIIAAMKILLKSGKQVQHAFVIQYVNALPDISCSGISETVWGVLIQGYFMVSKFSRVRNQPQYGGTTAPPATPLPPRDGMRSIPVLVPQGSGLFLTPQFPSE